MYQYRPNTSTPSAPGTGLRDADRRAIVKRVRELAATVRAQQETPCTVRCDVIPAQARLKVAL